jgi:hypothetical protein
VVPGQPASRTAPDQSRGDTAWIVATTVYDGTFQGLSVSFVGAKLMVLTRQAGEWRIRAIHSSSHES